MSRQNPMLVEFSTSLYRLDAIKVSMQAFQACAVFSIKAAANEEEQNVVQVLISDIHPSLEHVLLDSFCNHVLFETIVQERREQGGQL